MGIIENIFSAEVGIVKITSWIRKTKTNRSPGQYGIPVELLKLLDDEELEVVCDILNHCSDKEIMPDEMELAELITLYKKANVEDPANYRPISVPDTTYKLYAAILQKN